jgi:predicted transcriptional regulator
LVALGRLKISTRKELARALINVGMSYGEVAKVLHVSSTTIRNDVAAR